MNKYIEITLLPDATHELHKIFSQAYMQIHLAFVESKNNCGIGFPCYKERTLGNKIRIFGEYNQLASLELDKWFSRMKDIVHIKAICSVPENVRYATYAKVKQKKTLNERIEHQAKRRGISIEQSAQHFKNYKQDDETFPFVKMKSESNDALFFLFVKRTVSQNKVYGCFNSYGLSQKTTVPEW